MESRNTIFITCLFFFPLILFGPASLPAQWMPLQSGTARNLHDLSFLDANYGLAVGDTSTVLLTTDGGKNWLPVASGFKEDFQAALILNRDSLMIAGGNFFNGSVYRTVNGGFAWDYVGLGIDLAQTPEWVYSLSNEFIFKSPNRGANWKPSDIIIGSTTLLEQLQPASESVIYAFGNISGFATNSAFIYRTDDGGDSWWSFYVEDFPNANAFTAAAVTHPDTVFLFVNELVNRQPGPVNQLWLLTNFKFSTENLYRGWRFDAEVVNTRLPAYIRAADFRSTSLGYAAGSDGRIYRTDDGGRSWEVDYESATPLEALVMIDDVTGYAAGENGLLLKRTGTTAVTRPAGHDAVRIFPNPACGYLNVVLPHDRPALLRLTNAAGQLLHQAALTGRGELPLPRLPAGMYILEIQQERALSRQKIVVNEGCR